MKFANIENNEDDNLLINPVLAFKWFPYQITQDYLQTNNYLSEFNSEEGRKKVLKNLGISDEIEWNEYSNLNFYKSSGNYDLIGTKLKYDNIPIDSLGLIKAKLSVIEIEGVVTQFLYLVNHLGGEGNIYIRSFQNEWKPWAKLQTNVEVGKTNTLDHYVDNGIYSGVLIDSEQNPETFVLIVINNYSVAELAGSKDYLSISLLKYGLSLLNDSGTLPGIVSIKIRTRDAFGFWGEWSSLDLGINSKLEKINLDISSINEFLDQIYAIVDYNDDEYKKRFNSIESLAMMFGKFNFGATSDHVTFYGHSLKQDHNSADIPAATTKTAGVMTANDKTKIDKLATVGTSVNLNEYTTEGVYYIHIKDEAYNYPILTPRNSTARLTVVGSYDGNNAVITQVLNLNNNAGGEGNVYIRAKLGDSWGAWGKLQTNIEVNAIGLGQSKTFNDLTDNGIYSGVNVYAVGYDSNGYPITAYETFVLVVINAYLTGGGIAQLKYSILLNGTTTVKLRNKVNGVWGEWQGFGGGSDGYVTRTDFDNAIAELQDKLNQLIENKA